MSPFWYTIAIVHHDKEMQLYSEEMWHLFYWYGFVIFKKDNVWGKKNIIEDKCQLSEMEINMNIRNTL